ncbi:MAG: IPTL-CTERM sorting domain-containing protein [Candidatus Binatia bacterium]
MPTLSEWSGIVFAGLASAFVLWQVRGRLDVS